MNGYTPGYVYIGSVTTTVKRCLSPWAGINGLCHSRSVFCSKLVQCRPYVTHNFYWRTFNGHNVIWRTCNSHTVFWRTCNSHNVFCRTSKTMLTYVFWRTSNSRAPFSDAPIVAATFYDAHLIATMSVSDGISIATTFSDGHLNNSQPATTFSEAHLIATTVSDAHQHVQSSQCCRAFQVDLLANERNILSRLNFGMREIEWWLKWSRRFKPAA